MKEELCDASFAKLRRILHQTRTYPYSPLNYKNSNKLRLGPLYITVFKFLTIRFLTVGFS